MARVIPVDFRARAVASERANRALLHAAAGLRLQAAQLEASALLTGPRQLAVVDAIATDIVGELTTIDSVIDELMQGAPRVPLGGKEIG